MKAYPFSPLRSIALITLSLISTVSSLAQNSFPDYAPIYKDDIVGRVDITIHPDSLAYILAPGNEESEYYFHATFMFDNGTIRDTFENIGFQLRGNTTRYAKKKSFQVSLNTYASGRKWYGVEKLNLNAEPHDPTVSRSKIAWDLIRGIGVPAPRSSHVDLYINGAYHGIYANVEHIDEEFVQTRFGNNDGNLYKCTYPADLAYRGNNPEDYKFLNEGERVYELKTNEEKDDYSDLVQFIDVLNNTPTNELPCELEKIFNVNSFLKSLAFDVLAGNWDGPHYAANNFYLYHNLSSGQFEYIPYDLDNTFGISWYPISWAQRNMYAWSRENEPRPLYVRILEIPEYRDRFSYYMNQIIESVYTEELLFPKIDVLQTLLTPSIVKDTFYRKEYDFDLAKFNLSFSEAIPYPHTPIGIKPFITERRNATIQQLEVNDIAPIISNSISISNTVDDPIILRATVEDDQGLDFVELVADFDGQFEVVRMHDNGQNGDGEAGDGIYGAVTIVFGGCVEFTYTIRAKDIDGNYSFDPVCGSHHVFVCNSSLKLSINEFLASNENDVTDDHGEHEDWIEIFNYGTETVSLGGLFLTDKPENATKWAFPDTTLAAGGYLIVWADEDLDQGPMHANIKLSAGGEYVGLYDNISTGHALIDGIEFGEQQADKTFGRFPNGTGPFQILKSTPGYLNELILAVQDDEFASSYIVFPNPAKNIVYIKSNHPIHSNQRIVLLNIFGQVLMNEPVENLVELDVSELIDGIYLVGIKSEDGMRIVSKVIKD